MSNEAKVKWAVDADFLQACNCDFGCPCEFSAPPTRGFCEGVGAWRINKGNYGTTKLDGLALGFAAHWPRAIHEGNGTVCLFFDERANPQQREALLQIASGQAGGMPFEIIVTTFSKIMEPRYVPFTFNFNGRTSSVRVGSFMSAATAPIKNPVTGEPESVRVEHATGFIFKEAEAVAAEECRVDVEGMKFSWPNKAGFVTKVRYSN
ncbi:MAG TPA: DUF1326 domain-containing protein [Candidatus Angelobacter sp.]|nr:DUF1326 domain-containing protein [Candidatus Angelobacter sp.]